MATTHPFRKSRDLSPIHAAWAFAAFALIIFVIAFTSASRADSLWSANGQPSRSMFADRKAAAKGDILTIVIAESAVVQSSQNKTSNPPRRNPRHVCQRDHSTGARCQSSYLKPNDP